MYECEECEECVCMSVMSVTVRACHIIVSGYI